MANVTRMLALMLAAAGLLVCFMTGRCAALRDMLLVIPPVAQAGSSVTLRCLYDLEGAKLYAVKWYRGNFEFYRTMPNESPPKQAFAYPDIHVDLAQSDEHQVTLLRVPLHMSGIFSCEVSTEAPSFTTLVKRGHLKVLDTVRKPVLTVSKNVYRPGEELLANCSSPSSISSEPLPPGPGRERPGLPSGGYEQPAVPLLPEQPPLQPHQLTAEQRRYLENTKDAAKPPSRTYGFWVNNKPVPASMVQQGPTSATLRRPLAEEDFSAEGELRLKCVLTLANKYREPSGTVLVRRLEVEDEEEYEEEEEGEDAEDEDRGVEESPITVTDAPPALNAVDADRSISSRAGERRPVDSAIAALVAAVLAVQQMGLNHLLR